MAFERIDLLVQGRSVAQAKVDVSRSDYADFFLLNIWLNMPKTSLRDLAL